MNTLLSGDIKTKLWITENRTLEMWWHAEDAGDKRSWKGELSENEQVRAQQ
jgi:hypothetical protein